MKMMNTVLADFNTQKHKPTDKLSKADINELPLYVYDGPISFINTPEAEKTALSHLHKATVIGLDTETRPNFRKGVVHEPSLIQVATEKQVFIFHIKVHSFSKELASIFENKNIIKTGVGIGEDMRPLASIQPFSAHGLYDLGNAAKRLGLAHRGLRGLAALFLGIRISKSCQCSNWGRIDLSQKQITYAATDAWVSLALYRYMQDHSLL